MSTSATGRAPGSGLRAVLLPLALAQFVCSFAGSSMNVMISDISVDLNTTVEGVQVAITLFLLVMAALMIPGGKLTDKYGRKFCFVVGLGLYGAGALISALSPSLPVLILGNSILEGVGTALLIPPVYILTTLLFSTVTSRARAFGIISAMGGIGAAAGPLISGLITSSLGWRASFLFQVLIVAVILWLARKVDDPVPADPTRSFDTVWRSAFRVRADPGGHRHPGGRHELVAHRGTGRGGSAGVGPVLPQRADQGAGREGTAGVQRDVPQPDGEPRDADPERAMAVAQRGVVRGGGVPPGRARAGCHSDGGAVHGGDRRVVGRLVGGRAARPPLRPAGVDHGRVRADGHRDHRPGADGRRIVEWLGADPGLLLIGLGLGTMLTPSVNLVQSSFGESAQGEISGLSRSVSNLGSSIGTAIAGTVLVAGIAATPERSYGLALLVLAAFGVLGLIAAIFMPRGQTAAATDTLAVGAADPAG